MVFLAEWDSVIIITWKGGVWKDGIWDDKLGEYRDSKVSLNECEWSLSYRGKS